MLKSSDIQYVEYHGKVLCCHYSATKSIHILCVVHKVHIYLESHSVCPLVGIGTPLPTLLQASVYPPPPPKPREGRTQSPADEGVGESKFGRHEKKLSTLLCGVVAQV
jgi:hypothetical protein